MTRLNPEDLKAFLFGQTVHAFDPDSRNLVATIAYGRDGTCEAVFADGTEDRGQFELSGDTYSTKYTRFRAGETNFFYLELLAPQVAQAYHTDGRRAFLQSPLAKPDYPLP